MALATGTACISVGEAPIKIGMSAPFGGPNHDLGAKMSAGIQLAFTEQNDKGGIRGRTLELDARDDAYDPSSAEANARALLDVVPTNEAPRCPSTKDSTALYPAGGAVPVSTTSLDRGPNAVLAVLGNVGTPTMVRFAPIAVETQTLFFGAFTGAQLILRDDTCQSCKRYIFNVRASYAQEARATLEYFAQYHGVKDYKHLISFDQNDTYGQAGYSGLSNAYVSLSQSPPANLPTLPPMTNPTTDIPRFRYERVDPVGGGQQAVSNVINHVQNDVLSGNTDSHVVGIMMTNVYSAAEVFIKGIKDWQAKTPDAARVKFVFSNISFTGPNSLATRLQGSDALGHPYSENVYVSQVVPNYADGQDDSSLVKAYRNLQPATDHRNFTEFEGYISARIFIAGLLAQKQAYTTESLIQTFENLNATVDSSLVLGANSGFSAKDHNYSKTVWGTAIQSDGTFKNVYFWQQGAAPELQPYQ
ncbi:MAG TPA: ABC transporter substrate-binding protein [Polyangiaceae bacterium]|nr:ABC transporter substrate-binding protein [Polyangiaceae bacterium]